MKKLISLLLLINLSSLYATPSKIKDLITIKGVRENPIIGYGLVIGLNGTGDGSGEILGDTLKTMFKKLGLNAKKEITSKNVASVIVTTKLPPFGKIGQKLDVTVSSIGSAKSLAGGTLLITPLKGGDGKVYAISSGNISIGGLNNGQQFPTTGIVINGATIEKEINYNFNNKKALKLSLKEPDFTTAARMQKVINEQLGGKYAISSDSTSIDLIIPNQYQRNIVKLMAIIENLKVTTDVKARIVINERTGTIVAGGNITLKPVAISHKDLTIEISDGKNQKKSDSGNLYFLDHKATLNDLVRGLNAFGTSAEDLISIFYALKKNGALIGEIELI